MAELKHRVFPASGRMKRNYYYSGFAVLVLFLIVSLFAGSVSPHNPDERFAPYNPPDKTHWLGTNDLGNDIVSELIFSARISVFVGLGAALIAGFLGILIGLTAGFFRGIADEFLMLLTDIVLLIPRIPLLIILSVFLQPGIYTLTLSIRGVRYTV